MRSRFFYGFMPYLIGVPLVLFGITALEVACGEQPQSKASQWRLGILVCLIYLGHRKRTYGSC